MQIEESSPSFIVRSPNPVSRSLFAPTAMKAFLAATFGYSLYYVCRLSLSVVKGPLVAEGLLTEFQLGIIGSALFYSYAAGKLLNGFLADRVDIRRFAAVGLLISAAVNLVLGFYAGFFLFVGLWIVNGWVQSMGACSFIVGLTRWFPVQRRGTFYGLWSASHNIGEGITFILSALVIGALGWRYGWWLCGMLGLTGVAMIWLFFHDNPASPKTAPSSRRETREAQWGLVKNPTVWLIAAASMFMYVSRYSVNSWGIFFLEKAKGYSLEQAGMIVSISSFCGIAGTVSSGWLSDRYFNADRAVPTILAGLLNLASLCLFLLGPACAPLDIASMILFGVSIGALICYLGGLMAVDVAGKGAAGAALGIVGMASYAGAGSQDVISGYLIGSHKTAAGGTVVYDFLPVSLFWIAAAALSVAVSIVARRVHLVRMAGRRERTA